MSTYLGSILYQVLTFHNIQHRDSSSTSQVVTTKSGSQLSIYGFEFDEPIKELRQRLLFEQKVFTGVSGTNVIRLLPPLCLTMAEADEFIGRFRKVLV